LLLLLYFFGIAVVLAKLGTAKLINQLFNPSFNETHYIFTYSFPTIGYGLFLIIYFIFILLVYGFIFMQGINDKLSQKVKLQLDGHVLPFFNGFVFGSGLIVSGMTSPVKVIGFMDVFGPYFDPSLGCVAVGAMVPTLIAFQFYIIPRSNSGKKPILHEQFNFPTTVFVDWKLIVGAGIFGLGYGLVGICPGPFVVNLGALNPLFLIFGAGFAIGVVIKEKVVFFKDEGHK